MHFILLNNYFPTYLYRSYVYKIIALTIEPVMLSGCVVGSNLVIQVFSDDHFSILTYTIENKTNPDGQKYEIGCYDDHPIFKGVIRSLIIHFYIKKFEKFLVE
jgi:hypothetical protein